MDPEPSLFFQIDTTMFFGICGIIILLFCCSLIAATEVAMFSLTQKDLDTIEETQPAKYEIIQRMLSLPKKLLATILITNNFLHIAIVILFSVSLDKLFATISIPAVKFTVEVILVTFLILLFGEVLPKVYASRNNIKFATFIAYPLLFLEKILTPLSTPMRMITTFLQKKLGRQKTSLSVDQLSQALELTSTEETSTEEQKILEGIVTFGNTDTKQVMSPRIDIFAVATNETFEEIMPKIIEKGYSRIPVYEENIDNITGILFIKDLIPYINKKDFDWKPLVREPFYVPENKKLDDLLKDFQSMKSHLAIVVDEFGGTSGLISLEDVIEEIVGDISDEFDEDDVNYTKIDKNTFLFEGKINLKDFYRITGTNEEKFEEKKGEAETLAGFILELLGNFPKKGTKIEFENVSFTIESVDKKRIKQIKAIVNE